MLRCFGKPLLIRRGFPKQRNISLTINVKSKARKSLGNKIIKGKTLARHLDKTTGHLLYDRLFDLKRLR